MTKTIGRLTWAVAEGYIPPASTGTTRELTSHETICILNANDAEAHVEITVTLPTARLPALTGLSLAASARAICVSTILPIPNPSR